MAKMNPEVKKRWVEALRSGKYEQGDGRLRRYRSGVETFCCAGVLCDILAEDVGVDWEYIPACKEWIFGQSRALLSDKVVSCAGLDADDDGRAYPVVTIDGEEANIYHHNDQGGKTFEQIAQAIEEQL